MKLQDLMEEPVQSSWIENLTLIRTGKDVTMVTNAGNRYRIKNVPYPLYIAWIQSDSKGKFWHRNIRGKFIVKRLVKVQ